MNNRIEEARKIVKETFENPFNKDRFRYFAKNLLNHIDESAFVYRGNTIPHNYGSHIKTLERIGKYIDPEGNKIDVLIVQLKKEKMLERARTMQRDLVARYLNGSRGGELKEAALVAFVSPDQNDWRFSLVKMDYRFVETPSGKVKAKEEFTPARRWSFLVGKNEKSHTAQSRLVDIFIDDVNDPSLAQLENAFDIEKVTKEFFEKYRSLYDRLTESLTAIVKEDPKIKKDFDEKSVEIPNFTKKLLGQIVFLYFLQKKGWFGVGKNSDWGTGPKDFLRLLFEKKITKYKNFFNDILEPLFYEALAKERDQDFYSRFNCKIPFLNGGLFDPINEYDWVHTDINLPNELFSNDRLTKEKDRGDGILDIFDRYNFTVKEDEPLEKEVAVDPEMLGKVFENLLEVKDRKSKGTYYTPREIVHYMCHESLINYLKTETKIDEERIRKLVTRDIFLTKEEVDEWKKEKKKPSNKVLVFWEGEYQELDRALKNIRVIDPACGSGAFLVGMLQEIVRARRLLQLFGLKNKNEYSLKEEAIQNCIYGVDINPGAVEIAKLRLWLSLVVEEDDIKRIRPLPNLDYKIMQGNSLIELLSPELLAKTTDYERSKLVDKLITFKTEFLNMSNSSARKERKKEIEKLIKSIVNYDHEKKKAKLKQDLASFNAQKRLFVPIGDNISFDDLHTQNEKKISIELGKLEKAQAISPKDHFEWHLQFNEVFEKGGFDIIIANPPYVRADSPRFKKQREAIMKSKSYQTLYEKWDLFVPFIEKGLKLLNDSGNLVYITSNSLCTSKFAFRILDYIQENYFTFFVDYFEKVKVFDAGVVPVVFGVSKQNTSKTVIKTIHNEKFSTIQKKDEIPIDEFKTLGKNGFKISNTNFQINAEAIKLGDICYMSYGLRPNSDERYWRGEFTRNDLISEVKNEKHPMPYLEGKNLGRYRINKILYLEWDTERIPKKLVRPTFPELYNRPKLLCGTMTGGTLDATGIICNHSIVVFIRFTDLENVNNKSIVGSIKKYNPLPRAKLEDVSEKFDLKYLLAVINSKFAYHFLNGIRRHRLKNYFYPDDFRNLPIADSSSSTQKPFIKIVDKILAITRSGDYLENSVKKEEVKKYEEQIDQMVYNLYGLTDEEIKIVENNGKDNKN